MATGTQREIGERRRRWIASIAATAALATGAAACGGGGDSGPTLSAAGERGKQLASSSGCSGCHGVDGQGGVGPTWIGLPGSQVELADGGTIVADDAYLVRSIADPGADLLADYFVQMPNNNLGDSDIADIVAYINDLNPATDASD